jgi:UDP-N-acetylglucosamine 2-epimerase (hydrolysing)
VKKKILVLAGTRPEIVKLAPVLEGLSASESLEGILCVTGQHSTMLDQALEAFALRPALNLEVMTENQSLEELTARIVTGVSRAIKQLNPDAVLVHGDTTTTMASALAAAYNKKPIGHIEAGLRTNDIASPFPEEINRQIVSRITTWNFAPTEFARENLIREGVNPDSIFVTGNTVVDALRIVNSKIDSDPQLREILTSRLSHNLGGWKPGTKFILFTAHRRENFGEGIKNLCTFLLKLVQRHPELKVLFPVHPNPNVSEPVKSLLSSSPNIHLVEPLDYMDLVFTLSNCDLVVTDSGGIQEEAVSLGKHVLVTRELTERGEGNSTGLMHLVGTNPDTLLELTEKLISQDGGVVTGVPKNPYGDGHAAKKIIKTLELAFG